MGNPQTVSPFMCLLPKPLHKRNVIHAYLKVPFPAFVFLERETCIFIVEFVAELRRIKVSLQPNSLEPAHLLYDTFREMQRVPAKVNQRQQLIHMGKISFDLVYILTQLELPCLMFMLHLFNLLSQYGTVHPSCAAWK